MQSWNTVALVKGTIFCVSVLFDLSPNKNKNNNKNNKVKCKLTLRVSKKVCRSSACFTLRGLIHISLMGKHIYSYILHVF